jgi:nickel-dependent lactate racemase
MRIGINYGLEPLELHVADNAWVEMHSGKPSPPLADPAEAVRTALEKPHGWPALRQAVTPDDHVAILVDEHLPRLANLLPPILEHLIEAGVCADAVTLLCPPSLSQQPWVDELPDAFQDVHVEVHDPTDRRKLSYLAMTRQGRRVYVNRTAVDADQLVVLTGRGYDTVTGYSGAEAAIYPALADEKARTDIYSRASLEVAGQSAAPACQEAAEVAWLLGAPFLVQIIEGTGDGIAHVVGGSLDSSAEGRRLLDQRWRRSIARPADLVVAGVSGDPGRQDFAILAQALASAARVVEAGGRIILLTQATPQLGTAGQLLCEADSPREALARLKRDKVLDRAAALQWASAVDKAKVFLLSGLPDETAEDLFTTPLANAGQVQRLVAEQKTCLALADAHKVLADVSGEVTHG